MPDIYLLSATLLIEEGEMPHWIDWSVANGMQNHMPTRASMFQLKTMSSAID